MIMFFYLAHAGEGASAAWHLPPLHPILVNFTAALIPASVLSDWLGRLMRRESLLKAGWWTMLYAAVITPFTVAAGWWWMLQMQDMNHWAMSYHKWLGLSMAVVAIVLAIWRGRLFRTERAPNIAYLLVATFSVMALVVQGHLGGNMTFGDATAASVPDSSSIPAQHIHGATSQPAATAPKSTGLEWKDHLDLKE